MLDTTIEVVPVPGDDCVVVRAHTVLFDKRSKSCFASLPKGGVVDVSSAVTTQVVYSVLMSKFARYATVCGTLQDFVQQCTLLLCEMVAKHYSWTKLCSTFCRFIARGIAPTYGETNDRYLLALVKYGVGVELHKISCVLPPPRSHFYQQYGRMRRLYRLWLRLPISLPSWEPLPPQL